MNKHTTTFNFFSGILFIVLFTYLILRSIFVEPIHDELATLFHYIDYFTIWGENVILDANNHLLNSFLSKVCYSVFGDHVWAIRLPNVLSFIFFFYAVYKIATFIKVEYLKYIFVVSFTCIPYVLDYFAYTRGYGMSMAFLMMGVYYFILLNYEYTTKRLVLLSFFLVLAIYANLNIVISFVLIFGYLVIKQLIQSKKEKNFRLLYQFLMVSLVTFLILIPAIYFAYRLKSSGALYYGNQDGLWLTTGAILSKLILQSDTILIKYALLIIISLLSFHFVYSLFKNGTEKTFKNPSTLFIGLFLGSLIAVELMKVILDTNYPRDRVAMHFIFFCVGAVIFSLQQYPKIAWISGIFLFLPIVGAKHFNLVTSVYSPDDRIEKADFDFFVEQAKPNKSTTVYFTQALAYAYHVRKSSPTDFIVPSTFNGPTYYTEEVVSSKTTAVNLPKTKGYTLLRHNPNTWATYLERDKNPDWKKREQILDKNLVTSDMYLNLVDFDLENQAYKGKRIKLVIEGDIFTPELGRETAVLVVDRTDKEGHNSYMSFNLNWAAGKEKRYKFKRVCEFIPEETADLRIYLYNPNYFNYELIENKVTVFEAKQ